MKSLKVKVYDGVKYLEGTEKVCEMTFNNVKDFEIKAIMDVDIYKMGFDCVDEYKEYFIIYFEDGTTSTFRNSHIDVFAN